MQSEEEVFNASEKNEAHENGKAIVNAGKKEANILYGIDDTPPWHVCIVLGLQHYLMMLSSLISIPYLLAPAMCIPNDNPARGHMLSTIMLVGGLSTLLQTTFGSRLPIVQGGTFALVIPALAILNHPNWHCDTSPDSYMKHNNTEEFWMKRMREIQGGVLIAGAFETLMGVTGLIGLLLRFVTPLAIAPTIALIGLATFQKAAELASSNWPISILTMVLLVLFSQYLKNVNVPLLSYQKKKFKIVQYPLFKVFSVFLTIVIMWLLSVILTTSGAFHEDSLARTDRKLNLLHRTEWFRIPYPGQWGVPTASAGAVLGMAAGVMASIVESIGDYYACARISEVPMPPKHAVNRGIAIEGLGCIFGGIWGSGNGTTSYSQNIAAIGITRVASLRVVQFCAVLMIFFAVFGKFGALFVTIPEPIIGGIFCVLFGMVTSVGLSNLQFVDMDSPRNMFILGFSLFMGLVVPKWVESTKNAIQTGSEDMDQICTILLSTPMFVAGFLGVLLDNTIPGTPEETAHHKHSDQDAQSKTVCASYDFPCGMSWVRQRRFMQYVPISPTYKMRTRTLCQPPGLAMHEVQKESEKLFQGNMEANGQTEKVKCPA